MKMKIHVLTSLILGLIIGLSSFYFIAYAPLYGENVALKEQTKRLLEMKENLELENKQQAETINALNEMYNKALGNISKLERDIDYYKEQLKIFRVRRPSLGELQSFLREDETNTIKYQPNFFTCGDFAILLKTNARRSGLNISVIFVWYYCEGSIHAHALDGAYLDDGTFVYIEPQTDGIYSANLEDALVQIFHYSCQVSITEEFDVW